MVELFAKTGDPDQRLHSAASDLGLHCLPVTCLGVSSLQLVKIFSGMAKSVDPDQSDLGLHCLNVLFCHKLWCTKLQDILMHLRM